MPDAALLGKYQVDDYIRETGLPAVFLYTGNFYENMVYRSHMVYHAEKDQVEFRQPIVKETTQREFPQSDSQRHDIDNAQVAMLYVEKDLSAITKAIFDQWDAKEDELNHQYLYCTNARLTPLEITESVKKSKLPHLYRTLLMLMTRSSYRQ